MDGPAWNAALAAVGEWLRLDPQSEQALRIRAEVLERLERREEAAAACLEAARLLPERRAALEEQARKLRESPGTDRVPLPVAEWETLALCAHEALEAGKPEEAERGIAAATDAAVQAMAGMTDEERTRFLAQPRVRTAAADPATAAPLLDAAFAHLKDVRANGWEDLEYLRRHPDLEALRRDPRWGDSVAEKGGGSLTALRDRQALHRLAGSCILALPAGAPPPMSTDPVPPPPASPPPPVPPTTAPTPSTVGRTGGSSAPTLVERSPKDTACAPTLAGGVAPPVAPFPAAGGNRLGKYELLEEVGRGGMGVVYRAQDCELRREVALKTILLGDAQRPDLVERLLREARTAATLDHPGIIPIYDVGTIEGLPYFAMAYVRGRTFDALLRDETLPGLRERVAVVLDVARAVAHAHERQVVHRDLKPSNVLVDGAGRVHVMDFGLAKRLDDDVRLTATGQLMGTPQYMSPEQLDADVVGPPSDVYSLGAVLYQALVGSPPFVGSTMAEIVARSLSRDPEPPRTRNPRVPLDLETICLKALEKEPARRYPHAGALAADLARWLSGEAIEARAATWRTTMTRRIVRRKALAAAIVASTVALAALVAATAMTWSRSRLQARLLEGLREKAEIYVDAALALRRVGVPGSLRKAQDEYLPRLVRAVEDAERERPDLAEPRYHLGRLQRAIQRFDDARRAQETALARDPGLAPARYERAVLVARAHAVRLSELRDLALQEIGNHLAHDCGHAHTLPTDAELEERDPAAQELRRILLADLEALGRDPGGLPGPAGARDACLRGLALAYAGGDPDEARSLLARALEIDPTLEEAYEAWAAIEEALGRTAEAEAVYTRALEADRGYIPFLLGRAGIRLNAAVAASTRGQDATARNEGAVADLTRVLELDPNQAYPWARKGGVHVNQGVELAARGVDPTALYREAIACQDRALALQPDLLEALSSRAMARINLGVWGETHGEDPDQLYATAIVDLERTLVLAPLRPELHLWLGTTHMNRGSAAHARGRDVEAHYRSAIEAFDRGLANHPFHPQLWLHRGAARGNQAEAVAGRGQDPEPLYEAACKDGARALELAPDSAIAWMMNGQWRNSWALHRAEHGQDPRAQYEEALRHFGQALTHNPADANAWLRRASVHVNRAVWYTRSEGDPEPDLRSALGDLERSLAINGTSADAWSMRGTAHINLALCALTRGEDPGEEYSAAIDDLGHALELNPQRTETWLMRGEARNNWATWKTNRGDTADDLVEAALADLTRAADLNPTDAGVWDRLGGPRLNRARSLGRRGLGDPPAEFAEAVVAFEKSLAINPRSATCWGHLGECRMFWGNFEADSGRDPQAHFAAADAALAKAVELNPRQPELLTTRATLHGNWARWQEQHGLDPGGNYRAAVADFDQVLAVKPSAEDPLRLRGWVRTNWAGWTLRQGGDPQEIYRAAIADFDAALAVVPDNPVTRVRRAEALAGLAWYQLMIRRPADEFFQAALADLEAALQRNPRDAEAWWRKGWILHLAQQWATAVACFEESRRLDPRMVPMFAASWAEARARLAGGTSLEQLDAAARLLADGRPAEARAAYEKALESLAAQPASALPAEPMRVAHYNLACLYALAAAGQGADAPPDEAAQARWRDSAFAQLERAIGFGWSDRGHTERDPDLAALRGDERWGALLARLR